jgi:multidrug efflux pump subunit AcrB
LAVNTLTVAVLFAPLFSSTLTVTTFPLTEVLHHVSVDEAETELSLVVAVMVFPVLSAALVKDREAGATVSRLFLSRKRYYLRKRKKVRYKMAAPWNNTKINPCLTFLQK